MSCGYCDLDAAVERNYGCAAGSVLVGEWAFTRDDDLTHKAQGRVNLWYDFEESEWVLLVLIDDDRVTAATDARQRPPEPICATLGRDRDKLPTYRALEAHLGWQEFLESARASAAAIEELTFRIGNGGRGWSAGGGRPSGASSPTESAAITELTVVPRLVEQRDRHIDRVGIALAAIQAVRDALGRTEGDILEMFYVDGLLTWEIAAELGITVDGVFYRKRKALAWMDGNLPAPE